jgi:hypothetical protein
MIKYLLIFFIVSCTQTQAPTEKVYKKRFEVNKVMKERLRFIINA